MNSDNSPGVPPDHHLHNSYDSNDPDQAVEIPAIHEDIAPDSRDYGAADSPRLSSGTVEHRSRISALIGGFFAIVGNIYSRRMRKLKARNRIRKLHNSDSSPWLRRLLKLATALLAACTAFILIFVFAFGITYHQLDISHISANAQVSYLYYDDGSLLGKIVPDEGNRTDVTFEQIPQSVKDAVLAAEDRQFYSNPGFSVTGFARALWGRLVGEGDNAGGGSTIGQQYIKNVATGDQKSLLRKWKELVFSIKLTQEWSKDKILTAYLNTIYFGRNSYGIATAARTYFNKPIEKITVPEAALLAGLIRGPSLYDPATNSAAAHDRWKYVINSMVATRAITAHQAETMKFPRVMPKVNRADAAAGPLGLIRRQVLNELSALKISETQLRTQGLRITTTINKKTQEADTEAVRTALKPQPASMRSAVVSIDPKSGAVRGYFGGWDGNGYDYAQAGLQTGSTFKVFGLLAALEQNIPLSKKYSSAPYTVNGITIKNSDNETCGTCNIATGLKMSLNTVYYRLMHDLNGGADAVAQAAHQAGIAESFPGYKHTLQEDNGNTEGGVVLGQYPTRVFDMASAYATIANNGKYYVPHFIEKIVNSKGDLIYDREANNVEEQRFSADVANNAVAAMEPIAQYSRSHQLSGGRPSASKTGTTQLGDSAANKDAWMVGFTPQLSTAVWVGSDHQQPLVNSWGGIVYGSGIPADIWKSAMDGALQGKEVLRFPTPGPIGGQAGLPGPSVVTVTTKNSLVIGGVTIPLGDATVTKTVDGDGKDVHPSKRKKPDQSSAPSTESPTSGSSQPQQQPSQPSEPSPSSPSSSPANR